MIGGVACAGDAMDACTIALVIAQVANITSCVEVAEVVVRKLSKIRSLYTT